jgi:hypothetical protein
MTANCDVIYVRDVNPYTLREPNLVRCSNHDILRAFKAQSRPVEYWSTTLQSDHLARTERQTTLLPIPQVLSLSALRVYGHPAHQVRPTICRS